MKLKEALEQYENDIKVNWPNGVSFKNKSVFEGLCICEGEKEIMLTQELLNSEQWSIAIRPKDKEFIDVCNGLLDKLNPAQ